MSEVIIKQQEKIEELTLYIIEMEKRLRIAEFIKKDVISKDLDKLLNEEKIKMIEDARST